MVVPVIPALRKQKKEDDKLKVCLRYTVTLSQKKKKKGKDSLSQALVAHACNSSYSGGRDQEN
jgi:hypothetical protein